MCVLREKENEREWISTDSAKKKQYFIFLIFTPVKMLYPLLPHMSVPKMTTLHLQLRFHLHQVPLPVGSIRHRLLPCDDRCFLGYRVCSVAALFEEGIRSPCPSRSSCVQALCSGTLPLSRLGWWHVFTSLPLTAGELFELTRDSWGRASRWASRWGWA